eukprot:IDg3887t1
MWGSKYLGREGRDCNLPFKGDAQLGEGKTHGRRRRPSSRTSFDCAKTTEMSSGCGLQLLKDNGRGRNCDIALLLVGFAHGSHSRTPNTTVARLHGVGPIHHRRGFILKDHKIQEQVTSTPTLSRTCQLSESRVEEKCSKPLLFNELHHD